jgi:hypothetical protein
VTVTGRESGFAPRGIQFGRIIHGQRSAAKVSFSAEARDASVRGRAIQATIDRQYPSKFPPQHLTKPGSEADLKVRPKFEAPACLGSETKRLRRDLGG